MMVFLQHSTVVLVVLTLVSIGHGYQPPCHHPLRIVLPFLFKHCNAPQPPVSSTTQARTTGSTTSSPVPKTTIPPASKTTAPSAPKTTTQSASETTKAFVPETTKPSTKSTTQPGPETVTPVSPETTKPSAPENAQPCIYSPFTEWEVVPDSLKSCSGANPCPHCETGQTYQERRTRTSDDHSCTNLTQTSTICFPNQEEQLIIALGLGSSGHNLKPIAANNGGGLGSVVNPFLQGLIAGTKVISKPDMVTCPGNDFERNPVCQHLFGKRSTPLKQDDQIETEERRDASDDHEHPAISFNRNEHGPRLRRQARQCSNDEPQHILFVLDSSGSIGKDNYDRMKNAIARLVPMFCKQIRMAMVTFSNKINLDFCFDCFENTYEGRDEMKQAINGSHYQSHMTYTGATVKCICEELLSKECGISSSPSCLDVVFITDGKSNDKHHKVCHEVECLHNHTGINTYAIGINNYDKKELDCIARSSNLISAFNYPSFDAFETSINILMDQLVDAVSKDPQFAYACYDQSGDMSPTGAVVPEKT